MTSTQIIIWMHIVGAFATYGFIKDIKCVPWVRIPIILLWPASIPFATVLAVAILVIEDWRGR